MLSKASVALYSHLHYRIQSQFTNSNEIYTGITSLVKTLFAEVDEEELALNFIPGSVGGLGGLDPERQSTADVILRLNESTVRPGIVDRH